MIGTAIGSAIVGVVNAVIVTVTAFGLSLSSNQIGSIQLLTNAVLALGTAIAYWITNRKKKPPDSNSGVKIAETRSIV